MNAQKKRIGLKTLLTPAGGMTIGRALCTVVQ